ncbi:MAG TPA: methylamine dehydrogenase accessory protein MauD [Methylophilaceae bacterium]|nr:methylamine dehydrogenase accessory protein MauD [Methylophilaceae bacterium]
MINTLIFVVSILSILVIALLIMVFAMARQIGILFERITPVGAMINDAGPKIGDASPVFNLVSLMGNEVVIGSKRPHSTLVFFLSPTCPICNKLLPAIKSVQSSEGRWLDVVLASDGEADKHIDFINKHGLADFPYVLSQPLGTAYRVSRLPFAVLLDADGVVRAKGLINSREQLDSLFNAADTGYGSIQDYVSQQSLMSDSFQPLTKRTVKP